MQFVSQLKAYKANIKNKNGNKKQEMEKFKQQIKSQLKGQLDEIRGQDSTSLPSLPDTTDDPLSGVPANFDSSEQFEHLEDSAFFTPHELNPSMGHSVDEEDFEEDELDNFVPNTEPTKFKNDEQVYFDSFSLRFPLSLLGSSSLCWWNAKAWA
jgi:hypothetical protein